MGQGCTVNLDETLTNVTVTGSAIIGLISGLTTAVGAGEIGTTELADNAVTAAKQVHTDAGTNVMSSGSRWVSFAETYTSAPTVVASYLNEPIDSDNIGTGIGAGSITTGSFIAVGSGTSTGSFMWISFG